MRTNVSLLVLYLSFGIWFAQCHTAKEFPSYPPNPTTNPIDTSIEWIKIKESVWIHKSFGSFQGITYPSNGLVVLTNKGIVVIDTPWTEPQTEELIQSIQTKFQKQIVFVIVTHAHDDRMAGVSSFQKRKIPVYSTQLTAKLAKENGYGMPSPILDIQTRFSLGNGSVEVFYPGPGHSPDNIVVWLPDTHILFGGCLVKALEAEDLGNLKDANVVEWESSVKRVLSRYPDAEVVVPGHGNWGKLDLLRHTIRLLISPNH
ncbi:subclass B1 metallo-beta-lactamase [Leptospira paudalimensis]|uniref:beta-lactamase n=1 Tax=Leptospira paudalimensis TaxID=2950024 RepID=A0ABT3M8U4_9LEPT|nr:subclass B1 metallo-beta-lactamase [Leptospira paudalimensis]MCW7504805.1 subclass B1 metallo-beta-lactamase [Leptospira paudalimensis]